MTRKTTRGFQPKPGEIYDLFAVGGPRKLVKGGIHLQANHEYWIGASSSPDLIVVTRIDDSFVYFYRGDFRTERREQRPIADDLIRRGTQTWADTYGKHFEMEGNGGLSMLGEAYGERKAFIAAIRGLLEGKPSPLTRDFRDFQRVRTVVKHRAGYVLGTMESRDMTGRQVTEDLWYRAEQYGGVGSTDEKGPDYVETGKTTTLYHIHGMRYEAAKLAKDEAFEIVSGPEEETR